MATEADERVLARLYDVIQSRQEGGDTETSYTAKLFARGRREIAKKLGEEAVELALAALDDGRRDMIEESADLIYHMLVLWADAGIRPEHVYGALAAREGISGIAEKKARNMEEL